MPNKKLSSAPHNVHVFWKSTDQSYELPTYFTQGIHQDNRTGIAVDRVRVRISWKQLKKIERICRRAQHAF
jgi:hypothetical protein